jgi:hypothetical protein
MSGKTKGKTEGSKEFIAGVEPSDDISELLKAA